MAISSSLITSKSELCRKWRNRFSMKYYLSLLIRNSHIKTISLSSYNCLHQNCNIVYFFRWMVTPWFEYVVKQRDCFSPFCCDTRTRSHVTHRDSLLLQQGKKSTNELALSWSKSASIWWTACRPGCAQGELWCHDRFRSNPITLHLSKINKKIFHLARLCVHATRLPLMPSTPSIYLLCSCTDPSHICSLVCAQDSQQDRLKVGSTYNLLVIEK